MKSKASIIALLSTVSAFAGSATAPIESPQNTPAEVSSWEVRGALYGWAQSFDGDVGIRGRTAPLDLSFDDILKDLDIAFMGALEVGRDRWSFLADVNYAEVSDSIPVTDPATTLEFEQKQFLGNFIAIYETVKTDTLGLDVFAGARVNWIEAQLSIPTDSRSADKTWVDPIIGARFQSALSENFFFRALGDIGGFDVSSDLTWQAMAGFGYRVMDNGAFLLGYRGIGTDYTDGGFTYDVVAHGPVIGFEYHF
jgi:opacity protein-like surface antigen